MEKIYSHLFEIIIAVLLLFVSVLIYFDLRTETVVKTLGAEAAQDFVVDAGKHGYISTEDYENLMERLSLTNGIYDMAFEHKHTLYEPEYRMRTLQEILDAQKVAYTGTNTYTYREITTTAPAVYDPISNGSLNTETNESVLAKAANTPTDPNHVHTDACYSGHVHVDHATGFAHYHQHTSSCIQYKKGEYLMGICSSCGEVYNLFAVNRHWYNGEVMDYYGTANSACPNCGSTSVSSSYWTYVYGYSCGYDPSDMSPRSNGPIDYNNTYSYYYSSPAGLEKGGTATSGCYSYHVHSYDVDESWNTYSGYYYADCYSLFSRWKNGTPMCRLPAGVEIEMHDSYGNKMSIYYKVIYNAGTVSFQYYGCSGMDYQEVFPNLTLAQYLSFQYNGSALKSFIVTNIKYLCETAFSPSSISYSNSFSHNIVTSSDYLNGEWIYHYAATIDTCSLPEKTWYLSCNQEDNIAVCNQIVTNLAATHPVQTVAIGDPLITTAVVTYMDGSTKTLACTYSGYNSNQLGNQMVTLSYSGVSCTITVTVVPRTKICSNGHVYNLNSDGSDPGCPYCRGWIRSLGFIYPTSAYITITIGTTLQDNGVKLLATYMDGHTEEVSDYIDNLDKAYLGTMQVIVGYKGAATQLRVTTVCAKMKCDICGHYYELYPDGSDPGCPYCIAKIPVFTGNVNEYEETEYTEKILETLYKKGLYEFEKGDTFTVSIKSKSSTVGRKLLRKFIPSLPDQWFDIRLKGKISTN